RICATSRTSPKQTGSSRNRRHASCDLPHPGRPEAQIPIDHRLRPAGSGTVDFPTPHGVRNSKRERTDGFWRPDPSKQTLSSRSDEVASSQWDIRVRLVAGFGIALESLFANVIMPDAGAT